MERAYLEEVPVDTSGFPEAYKGAGTVLLLSKYDGDKCRCTPIVAEPRDVDRIKLDLRLHRKPRTKYTLYTFKRVNEKLNGALHRTLIERIGIRACLNPNSIEGLVKEQLDT